LPYNRETILATTPVILPAPTGVLAVSEPTSRLRVGVLGKDENEARARFAVELEASARLAELADARAAGGYVS